MASDEPKHSDEAATDEERTASRDLADGIDLMLRAAKKAMRNFEPGKLDELGRRAVRTVESLDSKQVSEFGRRAVKSLDPRKIEEVAQDAGRELMNVIERVTDRLDGLVAGRAKSKSRGEGGEDEDSKPRVRVEED